MTSTFRAGAERSRRHIVVSFAMLNGYHRQFLRCLCARHVRFLIIGGQARYIHFGTATRDLDIWADIAHDNLPALEDSIVWWSDCHQNHTAQPYTPPLNIVARRQIKFPDADVAYIDDEKQPKRLSWKDGIDLLTSIEGQQFGPFFARAVEKPFEEYRVRFLAAEDVETIAAGRKPAGSWVAIEP